MSGEDVAGGGNEAETDGTLCSVLNHQYASTLQIKSNLCAEGKWAQQKPHTQVNFSSVSIELDQFKS